MENSLFMLRFKGEKDLSIIAQSVLANLLQHGTCKNKLQLSLDEYANVNKLPPLKKKIWTHKYTSLRKVFSEIITGKSIPLYNFTYCVKPAKLTSTIQYIETTLHQIRAGQS